MITSTGLYAAIGLGLGGLQTPSQAQRAPAYRYNPGATKRRKARKAAKLARRKNRR